MAFAIWIPDRIPNRVPNRVPECSELLSFDTSLVEQEYENCNGFLQTSRDYKFCLFFFSVTPYHFVHHKA